MSRPRSYLNRPKLAVSHTVLLSPNPLTLNVCTCVTLWPSTAQCQCPINVAKVCWPLAPCSPEARRSLALVPPASIRHHKILFWIWKFSWGSLLQFNNFLTENNIHRQFRWANSRKHKNVHIHIYTYIYIYLNIYTLYIQNPVMYGYYVYMYIFFYLFLIFPANFLMVALWKVFFVFVFFK